MPTDMRALQDFEEEDKLQIKMNDVITIIEGRSVRDALLANPSRNPRRKATVSFQPDASTQRLRFDTK